jgi:membrane protein implicated in regulation of membrane protease activity
VLAKAAMLTNLRRVKKCWFLIALVLCVALMVAHAAQSPAAAPAPAKPAAKATPGMDIAHTVTTVTGVAISPLLGASAYGAFKWWKTDASQRDKLPVTARRKLSSSEA